MKIVLDAHTLVWWSLRPELLGAEGKRVIDEAESIGIPSIVFWEIALLKRKKKLSLGMALERWAELILSLDRVSALPLTVAIAMHAEALEMHPDPADRFIVATALSERALLITKDRALRALGFVETAW